MNDPHGFMTRALTLAARGRGTTSPNPMVGAVVVRDGQIVGEGWHRGPGLPHAEVEAINDAGERARGADIYVTLEPCNHVGRTPPCTRKIQDAGIRNVFVAALDPNPYVAGGGNAYLREIGIPVEEGLCREQAETLIEDFIWYVKSGRRPFVTLKCAVTLDGRIATRTHDSRWVTGPASRTRVHELRHAVDGILIGSGTLRADDPALTARLDGISTRDPRRVILDSTLRISPTARVITGPSDADTIVICAPDASTERRSRLEDLGVTVVDVPRGKVGSHAGLDLDLVMTILGEMGIMSLMIEGGGSVASSALAWKVVNKVMFFMAPKILGGDDGVPVCRGRGPEKMADAFQLHRIDTFRFDDDILVQGYLKDNPSIQ